MKGAAKNPRVVTAIKAKSVRMVLPPSQSISLKLVVSISCELLNIEFK